MVPVGLGAADGAALSGGRMPESGRGGKRKVARSALRASEKRKGKRENGERRRGAGLARDGIRGKLLHGCHAVRPRSERTSLIRLSPRGEDFLDAIENFADFTRDLICGHVRDHPIVAPLV